MAHEKPHFDVLGKIERERLSRNWTEYSLAKNSGIAQSTISTWFRKQLQPSVASIEKICTGLGITLSDFFDDGRSKYENMTDDQLELNQCWERLSPSQRKALIILIKTIILC